ncbi:MAG TPA: acyl-CoA dehydratase activase [Candidatus Acidoferrum sp.]|nr:acyl-CoA dehydratase activase [Candidatus Acidoferrum sp.]
MSGRRLGIGLDVGSTTTKSVIVDSQGNILGSHLLPTGASATGAAQRCLEELGRRSATDVKGVPTISTGYGRSLIDFAVKSVTEITCHSIGVHHLNPSIRLLIDVGGQDSKVIRIAENGRPTDFELNDKCSAGTGRFLEVMARVLEISIEQLGPLALQSESPCTISSTCTVFAESEVVGRIGAGESSKDIAAGIHAAIASKIGTLSKRVGVVTPICVTGGVALNPAFRYYMSKQLGSELWMPDAPQLTGALGAALLSFDA